MDLTTQLSGTIHIKMEQWLWTLKILYNRKEDSESRENYVTWENWKHSQFEIKRYTHSRHNRQDKRMADEWIYLYFRHVGKFPILFCKLMRAHFTSFFLVAAIFWQRKSLTFDVATHVMMIKFKRDCGDSGRLNVRGKNILWLQWLIRTF